MKIKIDEFTSNFSDTEFGEVEFCSKDLVTWSSEKSIIDAIETYCPFPINVYNVDFEFNDNIVIEYEVKVADYEPNYIENSIIDILEDLEDKIRAAKPVYRESTNMKDYKDNLKNYANEIKDDLGTLVNKNGFRISYKPYTRPTNINGNYIPTVCFDIDEVVGKTADINKLDTALRKFFKGTEYKYIIEELPGITRICIYY